MPPTTLGYLVTLESRLLYRNLYAHEMKAVIRALRDVIEIVHVIGGDPHEGLDDGDNPETE